MSLIGLPHSAFDVVVIDVPWPWETWSEKGAGKSPEVHYRTMTWDQIDSVLQEAADLLAPGGIAFGWATWPLLLRQGAAFRRAGFNYKTGGAWAKRTVNGKLRVGPGHIQRSACEPYFVFTRHGCPFYGKGFVNLIETFGEESIDGLAREHSRKPDEFYARIEAGWPNARRVDIFARQPRVGWITWGDEAEKFQP